MYIFVAKSIMHNFSSTFKLVVCNITHCFEPEYITLVSKIKDKHVKKCSKIFIQLKVYLKVKGLKVELTSEHCSHDVGLLWNSQRYKSKKRKEK